MSAPAIPNGATVLEVAGVQKSYGALRPLRIRSLTILSGQRMALSGIDAGASEVLVNLVTGAGLPDEGVVRVFGRATADIADGDAWLASLDCFGIVSPRAVILDGVTVQQNLAMPFGLHIDPVPPDIAVKVAALATECGLDAIPRPGQPDDGWLGCRAGDAPPEVRARVHLGRAIALGAALLVLEHPTADLPPAARSAYAADLVRIAEGRRLATLVITADADFGVRVAHQAFELQPATGALKPVRKGWFW